MQFYKNRRVENNQKVYVYFNLHKNLFSVKALEGEYKGKVILHTNQLSLDTCEFVVNTRGREKVLREKRKNVHAGVIGKIQFDLIYDEEQYEKEITYNPYIFESFVIKETKESIKQAEKVFFKDKRVYLIRPEN